jgi:hypothetical protein
MRSVFVHTTRSVLASMSKSQHNAPTQRSAGRFESPPASEPVSGYRAGARAVLPLMPAVAAFGAYFGVLAQAAGMGATALLVMSATTFAGSAQFAVVSVLGAGGTAAAAIVAAVLLNARYGPIALAAAQVFRGGRLRRLLEAQLLVDESWALSNRDGRFDRKVMLAPASSCTSAGMPAPRSAWRPATISRIPRPSVSTPPSRRCSSRCSRPCFAPAPRWPRRCSAPASRSR